MSLSFAGMGLSMLVMAAGLALPFLSGTPACSLPACSMVQVGRPFYSAAMSDSSCWDDVSSFPPPCSSIAAAAPAVLAGLTGPIALVGTLAYILSFAIGAGPVPGLLVPEITAARIRGALPGWAAPATRW